MTPQHVNARGVFVWRSMSVPGMSRLKFVVLHNKMQPMKHSNHAPGEPVPSGDEGGTPMWHRVDVGQGRPLVLLHGIGMSSRAWAPVLADLSAHRRVIAFDVAGFGRSPVLPADRPPSAVNLALALKDVLARMGITEPVDIVGNSMGGWMALEAARLGMARTVVAISPAGLWVRPPMHAKHLFFTMRWVTRRAPRLVRAMLGVPWLRELLLALPVSTGARHMPADEAFAAALDFAHAPGFAATFGQATRFEGGHGIGVPVTVAFGSHDWLLPRQARLRAELPRHVRWLEPGGWGHVPMWKDPQGVVKLILEGAR